MNFQKQINITVIGLYIAFLILNDANITAEASNNVIVEVGSNSSSNIDKVYKNLGETDMETKANTSFSIENHGWANISTNNRKEYLYIEPLYVEVPDENISEQTVTTGYTIYTSCETDEETEKLLAALVKEMMEEKDWS